MKKKNGFVFIETMIVVVVLIVSLMVLYNSYTGFMTIERRMARYDDPAYLYKAQVIADFLNNIKDEKGNALLYQKIKDINNDDNYVSISQLDTGVLFQNSSDQNFYANLINDLRIQNVIVINKNKIADLINSEIFDNDFCRYMKQLEKNSDDNYSYYLLVSFAEKSNGEKCDINSLMGSGSVGKPSEATCIRYYASIPINIY